MEISNLGKVRSLGNKPYLALSVLYLLYAFLTFVINSDFQAEEYHLVPFDYIGDFTGLFLAAICLGALVCFVGVKYFRAKVDFMLLALLGVLCVSNLVAMLYFPNVFDYQGFRYILEDGRRVEYIFAFFNGAFFLYLTYAIAPYACRGPRNWRAFYWMILAFAAFTAIWSFFSDGMNYIAFFQGKSGPEYAIQSFAGHKNVFAMILLFGILAEIMLYYGDKKSWHFAGIIIFYVIIFLAQARATFLAATAIFLCFFIYALWDRRKTNPRITIIGFSLLGVIALGLLLVLCIPSLGKVPLFAKIQNAFYGPDSTLQTRIVIWDKMWALLASDPMYMIFGLGHLNFNNAFFFAADNPTSAVWYTHNGYLAPFGEGGLIRGLISLFILGYLVYSLIKIYRQSKDKMVRVYFAFFVAFLIRSLFESEYLFTCEWVSMFWLQFIVVPLFGIRAKALTDQVEELPVSTSKARFPLRHLLLLCPSVLFSLGTICPLPYVRFPFLGVALCLQVVGVLLGKEKTSRIHEAAFVFACDGLVIVEALCCSVMPSVGAFHYMFACFFTVTINVTLYFLFVEYGYLEDIFAFWRGLEKQYADRYLTEK